MREWLGPESFLFPDSSSGQRSFWPILVEIWWVWFLGATVPVDLGTTLPKTHFQEQARNANWCHQNRKQEQACHGF